MYHFKFADIGEGLHEGKILSLNIKENEIIKENDLMFLVETDKVSTEITAPVSGTIIKINFQEGDVIKVGDVIVVIDDESTDKNLTVTPESVGVVGSLESSSRLLPSYNHENDASKTTKPILISPLARTKAAESSIDLKTVTGTGPNGRILVSDIEAKQKTIFKENLEHIQSKPNENVEYVAMSSIRKAIARNIKTAKNIIPEATVFRKIDITNLVTLRKQLKIEYEKLNIKLSYLPFIIKAVARALVNFPMLNCSYDETTQQIIYKKVFNLGIAIDTSKGLVVPVIRDVNNKSLLEVSQHLQELITKAKEQKLTINDMSEGSFTITNYGAVDIEYGTPIIRYPEAAILGMGKIINHITLTNSNEISNEQLLPISMTIDHRLVDGGDVGRFLQAVTHILKNPELLV